MSSLKFLVSRYGSFSQNSLTNQISWPHWDLLHIHSGDITVILEKKKIDLVQEQSILIPPYTKFRIQNKKYITTGSVQYFNPEIDTEIHRMLNKFHSPFLHRESNDNSINNHILELMRLYNSQNPVNKRQELLMELIVEKLICERKNGNVSNNQWGELIDKYLVHLERSPSIEDVARWTGYSPSRFRVVFKNETGMQPNRFFLNVRMEKAAQLLQETLVPLKEVAQKCGYSNISHFNRAFLKHYGVSPGRYRRRNIFIG